jgi:hypothetical protein
MATTMTSFLTLNSPPVSPTPTEARATSVPSNIPALLTDAQRHRQMQHCAEASATAARLDKAKTVKRRYKRRLRECQAAMAMLTLRPVFATAIPRHRVEPKAPDGTLTIHDRATRDSFVVYSPRFVHQFHAGHQAGKWYLRPLADLGTAPCSPAFPAANLAIDALRIGRWSISAEFSYRSSKSPRIIWSETNNELPEEGKTDEISPCGRPPCLGLTLGCTTTSPEPKGDRSHATVQS